jgi:hypothetical protein
MPPRTWRSTARSKLPIASIRWVVVSRFCHGFRSASRASLRAAFPYKLVHSGRHCTILRKLSPATAITGSSFEDAPYRPQSSISFEPPWPDPYSDTHGETYPDTLRRQRHSFWSQNGSIVD